MVTQISEKSRVVAESELQRLRKAEERLRQIENEQLSKVDVPGGKIIAGKRWDASKGEKGEYVRAAYANILVYKLENGAPVEAARKWTDKAGIEHPTYQIDHALRLPETVALNVFSGEKKGGTLWYSPRRR